MKIEIEGYHGTVAKINEYHEKKQQSLRSHMGASQLGHVCDRWLWLSFRWAIKPRFDGRMLRLFRRGHNEETIIVQDLRAIGVDIQATGFHQSRVDFGCHVSGSIDGIIESGLPEAPSKRHVAEFKTHSSKSFNVLCEHGVQKSKPMHYDQMQIYMAGTGIDRAFYLAVCKDDDRIYTERVKYDEAVAIKLIKRGQRLALDDRMPPPISTDPTWYQCKFCDAHEFCHDTNLVERANCRTCAHSTAKPDSTWRCERHQANGIPNKFQETGCDSHVLHPDMVPWELNHDQTTGEEAVWVIDGVNVRNGEPDAFVFASSELVANHDMCVAIINGDDGAKILREEFMGGLIS